METKMRIKIDVLKCKENQTSDILGKQNEFRTDCWTYVCR
jgi:hypothetical protein